MLDVRPTGGADWHDDHVDLSFRRPERWLDLAGAAGGNLATLLMGDALEGPFLVVASTRPTPEDAPRGPAHGHESDTWRITLAGASPMGNERYGAGEFRYQLGGRPYGADGYAYGPDGGYHLVMFGDRRGFPTQPVKREHEERYAEQNARAAASYGIDVPEVYPLEGRGVVTTLGPLDRAGKVNGSFADAASWDQVAPGVRASAGIFGHHTVGPLLLMVAAEAGSVALPALDVGTEVLVLVVDGSCTVGDDRYERGDARIQRADQPMGALAAGPVGVRACVILADRSQRGVDAAASTWTVTPAALLAGLASGLAAAAAL